MNFKTLLIVCAILFQVLAVASIALSKEKIMLTGRQIILQSAPLDPRDIFKGDYVQLDYLFSTISYTRLEDTIKQQGLRKGKKVYLTMELDEHGYGQEKALLLTPPVDEFYLAGYVKSHWPYKGFKSDTEDKRKQRSLKHPVHVKFGIEKYFVEQGQGLIMEEIRGNRDSFQTPMLMKIAVSKKGEAIIRSFEWATIAMKTEVIREADRNAPDDQSSATIRFTVKNKGEQAITLPLKQNGCSFQLIPTSRNPQTAGNFSFERPECVNINTEDKTLKTDEDVTVEFDLNQPQWRVFHKNKLTPLGRLPWEYRYRIHYEGDAIEGIHIKIVSSAFNGRGNID